MPGLIGEQPVGLPQRFFSAMALNAQDDLPGNRESKAQFVAAQGMWRVEIAHELAHKPTARNKRNKSQRANTFSFDHRSEWFIDVSQIDVVDTKGLWIFSVGLPRRMALNGMPVTG